MPAVTLVKYQNYKINFWKPVNLQDTYIYTLAQPYCIASFSKVKIFTNCPCPDFRGGSFHKSSIALIISAYYIILMADNAIIVFNYYIVHFLVWQSLLK